MPIEINSNCRKALRAKFHAGLQAAEIYLGRYPMVNLPNWQSELERIPGKNSTFEKSLHTHIDDDEPLSKFFLSEISLLLSYNPTPESSEPEKLSDLLKDRDLNSVADDMVSTIEALPNEYVFLYPLSGVFGTGLDAGTVITLNPSMRLMKPSASDLRMYPGSIVEFSLAPNAFSPRDEPILPPVLEIRQSGYYRLDFNSYALHRKSKAFFKVFHALGFAFNLLEYRTYFGAFNNELSNLAYSIEESGALLLGKTDVSARDAKLVTSVRLAPIDGLFGESISAPGSLRSFAAKIGWVFSEDRAAAKLRLASEWYFDSLADDDQASAFVRAVVVLEILLGEISDKSGMSLGGALRNRCAYAIGRDRADRDDILDKLSHIYALRSNIVHVGRSHLTREQHKLTNYLHSYCKRTLEHEVKFATPKEPYL